MTTLPARQQPQAADSGWTVERALALGKDEQLRLFASLPAPDLHELSGEYRGHASQPRSPRAAAAQDAALFDEASPFGYWLGKPDGARSAPTIFLLSGPLQAWVGPDDPEREGKR